MGSAGWTRVPHSKDVSVNVAANLIAGALIAGAAAGLGLMPRTPVAITWLAAIACTTLLTGYLGRLPGDRYLTREEIRISLPLAFLTLAAMSAVFVSTAREARSWWSIVIAGVTMIAYLAIAMLIVQVITKMRRRLRRIPGMHWIETPGREPQGVAPIWADTKDLAAHILANAKARLNRP